MIVAAPLHQADPLMSSHDSFEPEAEAIAASKQRKRASVHFTNDQTTAKRMSLFMNPRTRSLSESWIFLTAAAASSNESSNNNSTDNILLHHAENAASAQSSWSSASAAEQQQQQQQQLEDQDELSLLSSLSTFLVREYNDLPSKTAPIVSASPSASVFSRRASTIPVSGTMAATFAAALSTGSPAFASSPLASSYFLTASSPPPSSSGASATSTAGSCLVNNNTGTSTKELQCDQSSTAELPAGPAGVEVGRKKGTDLVIQVRDFAYPTSHPYHYGQYPPEPVYEDSDVGEEDQEDEEFYEESSSLSYPSSPAPSSVSTSSPSQPSQYDKTQGQARALYDFEAENSSELGFKEGEVMWIHCRQFPGWFLGEIGGVQGLVPENYVQMS